MSDFSKITEQFAHGQAHLQSMDKAAKGLHTSFASLLASVVGVTAGLKAAEGFIDRFAKINQLKTTFAGLGKTVEELKLREFQLSEQLALSMDRATQKALIGKEAEFRLALKEMDAVGRQLSLHERLGVVSSSRLAAVSTLLVLGAKTTHAESQLNERLIDANSSLETRFRLTAQVFRVQAQTGASLGVSADVMRALVRYGYENEKNFVRTTRLVVQLHEGLGLSVDTAAELAAVVERQVGGSFEAVADTVATIVNNTTLMADEAGRMALNMARLGTLVRKGGAGDALPEITKTVAQYEDALRRVGGNTDAIQRLLSRLTTAEGQLAAGLLGGLTPDAVTSVQGIHAVFEAFAKLAKTRIDPIQDSRMRVVALEQFSQELGLTAAEFVQLQMALSRMNGTQLEAITVQDRFRQQWRATNEGIVRLTNSLLGLLQGGLYPVVAVVNAVVNTLADLVQAINRHKVTAVLAATAVAGAVIWTTIQAAKLTKALVQTAFATDFAVAALERYRVAQLKNTAAQQVGSALEGGKGGKLTTVATTAATAAAQSGAGWKTVAETFRKTSTETKEALAKTVGGATKLSYKDQLNILIATVKEGPKAIWTYLSAGLGSMLAAARGGLGGLVSSVKTGLASVFGGIMPYLARLAALSGKVVGAVYSVGAVAGSALTALAVTAGLTARESIRMRQAIEKQQEAFEAQRMQIKSMRERQLNLATMSARYGDFDQAENARLLALKQERRELEREGASEARIQARLLLVNKQFGEAVNRGAYTGSMFQDPVKKTAKEIAYNTAEEETQRKIARATEQTAAEFKRAREEELARDAENARRRELEMLNKVRFVPAQGY